jgi:hypothetical protein
VCSRPASTLGVGQYAARSRPAAFGAPGQRPSKKFSSVKSQPQIPERVSQSLLSFVIGLTVVKYASKTPYLSIEESKAYSATKGTTWHTDDCWSYQLGSSWWVPSLAHRCCWLLHIRVPRPEMSQALWRRPRQLRSRSNHLHQPKLHQLLLSPYLPFRQTADIQLVVQLPWRRLAAIRRSPISRKVLQR